MAGEKKKKPIKEITGNTHHHRQISVLRNTHFWYITVLMMACSVFYYMDIIIDFEGWVNLKWQIFYTVHDLHRSLFLIPVMYTAYVFRVKGVIVTTLLSLLIFLPRALFVSPYPDPLLRALVFIVAMGILGIMVSVFLNSISERKQMEKELRLKAQLLDNATDFIYLRDLEEIFVYVNETALRALGYSREEFLKLKVPQTVAPGYHWVKDDVMEELLAKGEVTFENANICKDGSIIQGEVHSRLIESGGKKLVLSTVRDITERKQLMEKLEHSSHSNKLILDSAGEGILGLDIQGNHTSINLAAAKMLGYEADELIGKHSHSTWHYKKPDGSPYPNEECPIHKALTDGATHRIDNEVFWKKDGTNFLVEYTSTPIQEEGKVVGTVVVFTDITERKQTEDALMESEERYRGLFAASRDAVMTLEPPSWAFTSGNPATIEMFRAKNEADFLTYTPWTLSPALQPDGRASDEKAGEMINTAMREGSNFFEWTYKRIGGEEFFATVLLSRVKQGEKIFLHALVRDVTERRQLQQKLEEMATHDFLTGLPNRVLLLDRFSIAAALARRNKARLAVMSLDLDKFKSINDTLGHDIGDRVLKAVGNRLAGVTRASDTIARVGGDEFILVMLETKQREDATAIAQKILDSFIEPLSIDGHQLHLSTSIGIAIYPEDAEDMETLIKKSDAAMYYSKGHGRNQFKFFGDGNVLLSGDHKSATLI